MTDEPLRQTTLSYDPKLDDWKLTDDGSDPVIDPKKQGASAPGEKVFKEERTFPPAFDPRKP